MSKRAPDLDRIGRPADRAFKDLATWLVAAACAVSAAPATAQIENPSNYKRMDRYDLSPSDWRSIGALKHPEIVDLMLLASAPNVWRMPDIVDFINREIAGAPVDGRRAAALAALREKGEVLARMARENPGEAASLAWLADRQDALFRLAAAAAQGQADAARALIQQAAVTGTPLAKAALQVTQALNDAETVLRKSVHSLMPPEVSVAITALHSASPDEAALNMQRLDMKTSAEREELAYRSQQRNMSLWAAQLQDSGRPQAGQLVGLLKLPDVDQLPALVAMAASQVDADPQARGALADIGDRVRKLQAAAAAAPDDARRLAQIQARRRELFQKGVGASQVPAWADEVLGVAEQWRANALSEQTQSLFDAYIAFAVSERRRAEGGDFGAHAAAQILGSMGVAEAQKYLALSTGSSDTRIRVPDMDGYADVVGLAAPNARLTAAGVVALSNWPRIANLLAQSDIASRGLYEAPNERQLRLDLAVLGGQMNKVSATSVQTLESLAARREAIDGFAKRAAQGDATARADLSKVTAEAEQQLDARSRPAVAAFWKIWVPFIRAQAALALNGGEENALFITRIFNSTSDADIAKVDAQSPRRVRYREATRRLGQRHADSVRQCEGLSRNDPTSHCTRDADEQRESKAKVCGELTPQAVSDAMLRCYEL